MGEFSSIVEQAVRVVKADSAATGILLGRSPPNSGRRMPPSALFTGVRAHRPIGAWTISILANAAMDTEEMSMATDVSRNLFSWVLSLVYGSRECFRP